MSRSIPAAVVVVAVSAVLAVTGYSKTNHVAAASRSTSPAAQSSAAEAETTWSTYRVNVVEARHELSKLQVKGKAPMTGYSREQFGNYRADTDKNGCDQRNDALNRDLTKVTVKPGTHGCKVLTGVLHDPYTGETINFQFGQTTSAQIQIDHVVPEAAAWVTGAQQMTAKQRNEFSSDLTNLLAVDGHTNESKGDGDAATWLPPNKAFRCSYVARQIRVKTKWHLWVTTAEHQAMTRVLDHCPVNDAGQE